MTNQQGAPEALRPITRYEVVDCIDSKHVPAVIPNRAGPWVRYEDHVAALVEAQQPAPSAAAEWLEHAFREGWSACRDAEFVGEEAEDWAFGNSQANGRMIGIQQAAPQPSPTPQADSQPAPVVNQESVNLSDKAACASPVIDKPVRAPADSVAAPAGGVVAVPRETLRAWRQWCAQSMSHAIEHEISDFLAAAPTQPAQAADSVEHATRRWAAPKYDHQQREWCVAYEAETGFDPMMDDYEAGLKTFAEAAVASLRWYEDHTSDAHLRISRKAIPGGRYDAARKQGANHD